MDNQELLSKITEKKEFSDLPKEDIMRILEKYNSLDYGDEEKIKSTRDFLRKIYSSFLSRKLLVKKDVNVEWVLKKHKSTKERYPYYDEIYSKLKQKFKCIIYLITLNYCFSEFWCSNIYTNYQQPPKKH